MKPGDAAELLLLAALWGASFLFMRVGAPEFGPLALVFVRAAGAAAVLLPLLAWRREAAALRTHWRPIVIVGLLNTAVPFTLFTAAALVLNAGLSGIFNATAPLWAALFAWLWLGERPTWWRTLGLAVGFGGVLLLAADRASLRPGTPGISPALGVAACLLATACYGFTVNYTKRRLAGVPSLALAAGSQSAAALAMALPAWWAWPATLPGATAWGAAAGLALGCTALAYILYFRLIAHVGPAQAITVTYLIPAFAIAWGWLFLGEAVTPVMLVGGGIVLLGTALASGLVQGFRVPAAPR
ncbi:MAG: DMT family transporter [Rubrivivax sp.]|nr:DMT family transporter [Rubrivivax sp.]